MAEKKRTPVPGILGTNIQQLEQLRQLEESQGERKPKKNDKKKKDKMKGGVDDEVAFRSRILSSLFRRLVG